MPAPGGVCSGGESAPGVSALGAVCSQGVCSQGVSALGGLLRGGVCSGGCLVWGGVGIPACTEADTPPRETATAADGTHPTGMHSCFTK